MVDLAHGPPRFRQIQSGAADWHYWHSATLQRRPHRPIANGNVVGSGQCHDRFPSAPISAPYAQYQWVCPAFRARLLCPLEHEGPFQADKSFVGEDGNEARQAMASCIPRGWARLPVLTDGRSCHDKQTKVVRFDAEGAAPNMSREWPPARAWEGTRARAPRPASAVGRVPELA